MKMIGLDWLRNSISECNRLSRLYLSSLLQVVYAQINVTLVLNGCREGLVLYFFVRFLFSETDAVQNGLHLINLLLYFRRLRQFYVIGDQFS